MSADAPQFRIPIQADPVQADPTRTDTSRSEFDRYQLLAEFTSDVLVELDAAAIILWVSESAARVLGVPAQEIVGQHAIDSGSEHQTKQLRDAWDKLVRGEDVRDLEIRIALPTGERWFAISARAQRDGQGTMTGVVCGLRDIDETVRTRVALRASEELFRTSMMRNPNGLALYSLDGRPLAANPAFLEMLECDEEWLLSHGPEDVLPEDEVARAQWVFASVASGERDGVTSSSAMLRKDGSTVHTRWNLSLIRDDHGQPDFVVGQYQDETAMFEARRRLEQQAKVDPVTGLLSRGWITQELEVALRRSDRAGQHVGAILVDIDGFRVVNDSLGHDIGDTLLASFGDRLQRAAPGHSLVGRLNGDEYLIVVPNAHDAEWLDRLAIQIQERVRGNVDLPGRTIPVTASMGVAVAPAASTAGDLIRHADLAHHRAKAGGRSRRAIYDDDLAQDAVRRLAVQEQLDEAIQRRELVVHYQPVVRLLDREIVGFEALVRWQHHERGLISPDAFLPVAEETGLIVPLGLQVVDHVCDLLAEHEELPGRIAINLSALQLAEGSLLEHLTDKLATLGIDPTRTVIEITEMSVISLVDSARTALDSIRQAGIGVHMDDFGTGYSSISLLRDLPISGIKLDRSFVTHLDASDPTSTALAAGLAGLAEGLGLDTVAEGIENEQQARLVSAQGWAEGQGYLFGRPQPAQYWIGRGFGLAASA